MGGYVQSYGAYRLCEGSSRGCRGSLPREAREESSQKSIRAFTEQRRTRSEAKMHLFVYNRAKLISEAFVGEHLPARRRIGDNRHPAIFSGTSTFLAAS